MYNKDISVAQLIFPDIKKKYGKTDKLIKDSIINQNLDNSKPIEKKLIKKIEKK